MVWWWLLQICCGTAWLPISCLLIILAVMEIPCSHDVAKTVPPCRYLSGKATPGSILYWNVLNSTFYPTIVLKAVVPLFQYGPLGGSISNFRVRKVRKVTLTAELTAGQQSPIPNLYFNLFKWQLGNAEWNILKESWLKSMDTHPISYSGMSESQLLYIYIIYTYTHTHTIFSPCCGMKGMSHVRSLCHTLVHCMYSIQHRSLKSASELPRFLLGRGAAGSNSGINGLTSLARAETRSTILG